MLWELPLRAITGRRRPDHARIGQLEVTAGLRGPLSARERMDGALLTAGKITINQYRARAGLPPPPGLPDDVIRVLVSATASARKQTEEEMAGLCAKLSRPAVLAPWQRRWIDPANGSPEIDR